MVDSRPAAQVIHVYCLLTCFTTITCCLIPSHIVQFYLLVYACWMHQHIIYIYMVGVAQIVASGLSVFGWNSVAKVWAIAELQFKLYAEYQFKQKLQSLLGALALQHEH